jgi:tetratricopeptide (TPR) repeat protein
MRDVPCAACQKSLPMSEAFSVAEKHLCRECLKKFLEEPGANERLEDISRTVDPTICVHCSADQGDQEWPTLAGLPTCTTCEGFFRNRPYPTWLKASLAVFLCVAVAAFIYNLRYFRAYIEILQAGHAMQDGDINRASRLYEAASVRLPEFPELAVVPSLVNAQELIAENKNEEALALLDKTRPHSPPDLNSAYRQIEIQAKIGLAFDRKDYDEFLALSKEAFALAPNEATLAGSVASAYACKYAETGGTKFREQSLEHLDKAKELAKASGEDFSEYENRIQFRLATREIIDREEFLKRYPNGWKPEAN